jgi:protein-S-isoprenylcysteine O-methyltransferase Ste14
MLKLIDFAERLLIVLLAVPFVVAFAVVLPTHPQFVLVAASELLAIGLMLVRKPGEIVATPYAFAIAIIGSAAPLFIRPTGGVALAPAWLTATGAFLGLALSISAKLFLNRSFGIIAANRGVKQNGPYRIVRHPMYLGYIITQAFFLLASFTTRNLLLYLLAWSVQVLRIREEEKMLCRDPKYRAFTARVRYRLAPGLF